MPLLDVSDVLSDPMFQTTFQVIRSVESVTSGGVAQQSTQTLRAMGVVTPNDDTILQRLMDGSRIAGSITVHTKFALTDGAGTTIADIVVWRNRQWTVTSVGDWGQFGAGFVTARCELQPVSPPAATG